MNTRTQQRYEARARIIKAMAHPTRLFIVDELSKREHCVRELTLMIGSAASTVSAHLSILRRAGIVVAEKRGQQVYYSIKSPWVSKFVKCIESAPQSNAQQQLMTFMTG